MSDRSQEIRRIAATMGIDAECELAAESGESHVYEVTFGRHTVNLSVPADIPTDDLRSLVSLELSSAIAKG